MLSRLFLRGLKYVLGIVMLILHLHRLIKLSEQSVSFFYFMVDHKDVQIMFKSTLFIRS